jgi:hypothetical protein
MSVIGRLDNQVEEIIIAPIARRHEQKNKEREQEQSRARQEEEPDKATAEKEQSGSE